MRLLLLSLLCLLTITGVAAETVDDEAPVETLDHSGDDHDSPGIGLLLTGVAALAIAGFVRRS